MQCASMQQINQCSRKWQQINPSSTGLLPTLVPVARRRMRSATLSPATQASKAQQIIPSRSNGGSTLSEGHQASSGADSCSFGQRHLPTQLSSAKQQHGLRKRRSSPNSALNSSIAAAAAVVTEDAVATKTSARVARLLILVELRKVFRNCIRAESLLQQESPVYKPADPRPELTPEEAELEEQVRQDAAVEMVAEMQLTAEQLKASMRSLPPGFGSVFDKAAQATAEEQVREVGARYMAQLKDRLAQELPTLPFASVAAAQAAIDQRNARFSSKAKLAASQATGQAGGEDGISPVERLEQAEKVAEQFVARRIKPALRKAQESDLLDIAKETGTYLKGLWIRLNGGGGSGPASMPAGVPLPVSARKECEVVLSQLSLELEGLEKKLQEASKARETKLRKAGIQGRVQLAVQMKLLDAEVMALSRLLAVRTLQLEMEYIYRSLEDEALDIGVGSSGEVAREGSTNELALLVAEYTLVEEQLAVLASTVGPASMPFVGDDVLEKLAVDVPDLRVRVGVNDQVVFGGSAFSTTRLQLQMKESFDKVLEAINFLLRGVRLLGSDVSNAGRLFGKAALGNSLKAREVTALRRTARDILTFIPFTIILIIPLTPLGHVLVFGFIQRYFPGFFPSQFTKQRQEIMMRYEELQTELQRAQLQAEMEEEAEELARATAAVARLVAPETSGSSSSSSSGGSPPGGSKVTAAQKVKMLEEKLVEAREDVNHGSMDAGDEEFMAKH